MSTERVQMKSKLTQLQYDLKRARLNFDGHFASVRVELDPSAEPEDLNLDRARDMFNDLYADWSKIRRLIEEIKKLKAELYD